MTSRSGPYRPRTAGAPTSGGMRIVHHTEVVIDLRKAIEVIGPAGVRAMLEQMDRGENFDGTSFPAYDEDTRKKRARRGVTERLTWTGKLRQFLKVRSRYNPKTAKDRPYGKVRIGWTKKFREQLRGLWGAGYKLGGGLSAKSVAPLRKLIEREGIFTERRLR